MSSDIQELSYEMGEEIKRIYELFTPRGAPVDLVKLDELMQGAIDTHIHPAPDAYAPRPYDDVQLGIQACQAGMGAVVMKGHSFPTARTAAIADRLVEEWATANGKTRTRVLGGAVLNYNIGGLNPQAVESVAGLGGRVIWTPNLDSSHQMKITGASGGIEVIDENDKPVPELLEVFRLIAEHDLVLSITHHSTKERFIMVDAAREAGIRRIEIDHPTAPVTKMTVDQMKTIAKKGAYLGIYCVNFAPPLFSIEETVEAVNEIGADYFVLGTDLGNWRVPPPAVNYKILLGMLLERGISEKDVVKMAKTNAENLLF